MTIATVQRFLSTLFSSTAVIVGDDENDAENLSDVSDMLKELGALTPQNISPLSSSNSQLSIENGAINSEEQRSQQILLDELTAMRLHQEEQDRALAANLQEKEQRRANRAAAKREEEELRRRRQLKIEAEQAEDSAEDMSRRKTLLWVEESAATAEREKQQRARDSLSPERSYSPALPPRRRSSATTSGSGRACVTNPLFDMSKFEVHSSDEEEEEEEDGDMKRVDNDTYMSGVVDLEEISQVPLLPFKNQVFFPFFCRVGVGMIIIVFYELT